MRLCREHVRCPQGPGASALMTYGRHCGYGALAANVCCRCNPLATEEASSDSGGSELPWANSGIAAMAVAAVPAVGLDPILTAA